jgi:hypothetical protein
MPMASRQAATAEHRAVIYLRGDDGQQLDAAEQRCCDYADRFGWRVLKVIRDSSVNTDPGQLLGKIGKLDAQIILTDTLNMLSPDQDARDDLMMILERSECIVHPVTSEAMRSGSTG